MRQIREVIMLRQTAEWKRDVRIQERVMQNLMSATFAAAGSKKGAAGAMGARLLPDDEPSGQQGKVQSVEKVSRTFPVDPRFGLYTEAEIQAEAARQQQEQQQAA